MSSPAARNLVPSIISDHDDDISDVASALTALSSMTLQKEQANLCDTAKATITTLSETKNDTVVVSTAVTTSTTMTTIQHTVRKGGGGGAGSEGGHDSTNQDRVVHVISLEAIRHNFSVVEQAAAQQRCNVIAVVKADAYGHGSYETCHFLADTCGCEAFAVASLEEATALRKALLNPGAYVAATQQLQGPTMKGSRQLPPPKIVKKGARKVPFPSSPFDTGAEPTDKTAQSAASSSSQPGKMINVGKRNPIKPRIMVLGPPVGYPRCFDQYLYYDIEVMITGPKVASALMEWVADVKGRIQAQIQSAANDSMAEVSGNNVNNASSRVSSRQPSGASTPTRASASKAVTLSNVQGNLLAKELRTVLQQQQQQQQGGSNFPDVPPTSSDAVTASASIATTASEILLDCVSSQSSASNPSNFAIQRPPYVPVAQFRGITEVAKESRNRASAEASQPSHLRLIGSSSASPNNSAHAEQALILKQRLPVQPRKRLRWHALVDTGMGRLGFKPEAVMEEKDDFNNTAQDAGGKDEPVTIIKRLHNAEVYDNSPLEFYGLCTHMAEATEGSDYTKAQMGRFTKFLDAIRASGILVHSISTDNSSALLTTSLTHFSRDPSKILKQPQQDTHGFVRVGGAIYGQRPAFQELRTVSSLLTSVRHVATHKKGDSVGYDRAYVAKRDVRIATLTIGFADGYPRDLGNGVGSACIRGHVFPIAGNVCMDMLMVELGSADDREGPGSLVEVGDTATLWGLEPGSDQHLNGSVQLKELATTLSTTQSALTCGLDKIRVRRKYI